MTTDQEGCWPAIGMVVFILVLSMFGCSQHSKTEDRIEAAERRALDAAGRAEQANERASELEYRVEALEERLGM